MESYRVHTKNSCHRTIEDWKAARKELRDRGAEGLKGGKMRPCEPNAHWRPGCPGGGACVEKVTPGPWTAFEDPKNPGLWCVGNNGGDIVAFGLMEPDAEWVAAHAR